MLNRAPKLSLALLLCWLPPALAGQTPAQTQDHPPTPGAAGQPDSATLPVFKANAQTVVVNVVVTGRDGKPVHGLSKDRFIVAEDGHPQSITSFEEHTAGTNTQPVALPKLPPNFFTNVPRVKPDDALTVLLLDSLNTQIQDQATVREEMKRYLANPVPNRRIAIFTLSSRLRLIQGFTDDPTILSAALKTLKNGSGPQESDLLRTRADATLDQTAVNQIASSDPNGGATAAASAAALSQFFAEQTASQTSLRVDITIDAFQQLARYLGGIPGRKNVAWFSSSFPLQIFPDPGQQNSFAVVNDSQEKVRKTDAMLAAAQVAIYPIAAEGNAPDSHYDVETQAQSSNTGQAAQQQQITSLQTDSQQRIGNHTSMDVVADETGGKATYNTNGLAEALTQVATSGSEYYSLSYSPTNPAEDGQYRKISVKVTAGKVKLAYRRGYYAADAKLEKLEAAHPNSDPLAIFMRPGFPDSTELPLVLHVRPEPSAAAPQSPAPAQAAGDNHALHGPLSRYSVDVIIAARGLQLAENSDRSRHGKVMAALVAYDNNGHPLNWIEREVPLDMDAARFAAIQDTGVNFRLELDVPKDAASLRTGVMDVTTGHTGTLEVPLSDVAGAIKTASQTK
jgi:VWFA-related protein